MSRTTEGLEGDATHIDLSLNRALQATPTDVEDCHWNTPAHCCRQAMVRSGRAYSASLLRRRSAPPFSDLTLRLCGVGLPGY